MKGIRLFSAAVAVMMMAGIAHATPSTQIWIPSTDIQGYKVFHFGFDAYVKTERQDNGTREPAVINNGITVGVLPFKKIQAEVGIDQRVTGTEPADSNPLYFNLKVGTPEGSFFEGSPAFAIGGYDFGIENNASNYNIVYGLVAKTFPVGRFSVGYFSGSDELLLDDKGKKDNNGILASWDRSMKEVSDKLWFAVDYMGTKSGYGALTAGFSWKFADNVGVIFGYDIYNNRDLKPTATIQVDMDLK